MNGLLAAAILAFTALASLSACRKDEATELPELVRISAGTYSYRPAGDFRQGTRIVDAPFLARKGAPPLDIMKYQVTEAAYARCVAAGACPTLASKSEARIDHPQTGVNYADTIAYAGWLSEQSGQGWRLPTDEEWLRAAAERAPEDGFDTAANGADPAQRWIASYRREVALRGDADLQSHPLAHFGENKLGVADVAGNVWEWTETCFQNGTLTGDGSAIASMADYCGVRAVQGRHRAFIIDFVRDARSGGCAVGVPPDFLGFRLVRDS